MTRWPLVLILLLAYALSFIDRQVLGLLVDPVRRDLGVGDVAMGLLLGPAFGLFYAALGMPCGWLADRMRRTWLIAGGLLLWTAATLASGLAHSFTQLALARMVVGIGEAALVPAAVSLIADGFGPDKRALPLAVFTAGISLGAGLALIAGGALVELVEAHGQAVPAIGGWLAEQAPWRGVLVLAGLTGVPLALAILLWPEPVRVEPTASDALGGLLAHFKRQRGVLVPFLTATSLLYILSNAWAAWLPSLFIRRFGWTAAGAGARLGTTILVCALAGTLLSGLLATWLARRRGAGASLTVMRCGAWLLLPAAALAPLAGVAGLTLAGAALFYFALALCFGVATASLVAATPPALRGRMVALYLLLGNFAGLGLGPPLAGAITRALGDPALVGVALALLAVPTALPGALLLGRAQRRLAAA